ncbi:hypothetical protein SPRG_08301 [Saprolegnia parasitica CBS 223.65]|uniref:Uncharacterized protein n=1 Tax=Saprolegnia parasitica (strain CBS 223.65) TaxID=695850 RepID=A0A067CI76_SAPPC|nr:hypothetical protein SPRG_08301 [Saprolegnia parasitica CBS 223.65]KDO26226.1 hypothetical protein SPRG_08301 [Saprolegnia parasitica CBS 223.65]|eukprot:XP_012202935.1 hypothetical protein SPRG_08301 [Saprolegnia parasitica CBS 223.65]
MGLQWAEAVVAAEYAAALGACIYSLRAWPMTTPMRLAPPRYPRVLLAWRVACLVLYSITLAIDLYTSCGASLAYFTAWNFTLQLAYFAWTVKGSVQPRGDDVHLDLLFDVCITSALFVAFVFWTLLATPDALYEPVSITEHSVNVICLAVEFALNDRVVNPRHGSLVALWPLLYGIFTWMSHNSVIPGGGWPYDFMVADQPTAPLWYLGIFLLQVAFFLLCLVVSRLKRHLLENRSDDDKQCTSYGSV